MGSAIGTRRRAGNSIPQLFGDQAVRQNLSPQQMQALFIQGANPDVAFMTQSAPVVPPTEVEHTYTIRNDVNLKKDSLKITPVGDDRYAISFKYDASNSCTVELFYVAVEEKDSKSDEVFKYTTDYKTKLRAYAKGLDKEYDQSTLEDELLLDMTKVKPGLLIYDKNSLVYPVVIRLHSLPNANEKKHAESQSQTTCATLYLNEDGKYAIRVINQKIVVDGESFELQEIFGMKDGNSAEATEGQSTVDDVEVDDGEECVICMSEPRSTTILPCRHMCLCADCANSLRNQSNLCPICRTKAESFLQISGK